MNQDACPRPWGDNMTLRFWIVIHRDAFSTGGLPRRAIAGPERQLIRYSDLVPNGGCTLGWCRKLC